MYLVHSVFCQVEDRALHVRTDIVLGRQEPDSAIEAVPPNIK